MYRNFNKYKELRFSGHNTFPLKYGWLKKVFDEVAINGIKKGKHIFTDDSAVATLGVGKNMVSAMKYWSVAVGFLIENTTYGLENTELANKLLDNEIGLDMYLEDISSVWLIHWNLANTHSKSSSIYWIFNHWNSPVFDKRTLLEDIKELCNSAVEHKKVKNIAEKTLTRDIDCILRTYMPKKFKKGQTVEDELESPLVELNLLINFGEGNNILINQLNKVSLNSEIFIYAMLEFWLKHNPNSSTLSLDSILNDIGSPGRVFALKSDDAIEKLENIELITNHKLSWSEDSGVLRVTSSIPIESFDTYKFKILEKAYKF